VYQRDYAWRRTLETRQLRDLEVVAAVESQCALVGRLYPYKQRASRVVVEKVLHQLAANATVLPLGDHGQAGNVQQAIFAVIDETEVPHDSPVDLVHCAIPVVGRRVRGLRCKDHGIEAVNFVPVLIGINWNNVHSGWEGEGVGRLTYEQQQCVHSTCVYCETAGVK
jgi:hypothetical protein